LIRMAIFLGYIYFITLWKEIRRVFEYHGAEHKSIFAFEDRRNLDVASTREYTTLHPRCGTSFLFIVMLVSIFVFVLLGRPHGVAERLIRLCFVPLIGGLSYEIIKLSDKTNKYPFLRWFILPGLWLQKLTTREPDDSQLEVAIVALQSALGERPRCESSIVETVSEFT
jgi:uncharacterized protein YqhQ